MPGASRGGPKAGFITLFTLALGPAVALADEPRLIDVAGSDTRIELWQELDADGEPVDFYAISLDGGVLTTVRRTSYQIMLRFAEFDPVTDVPEVPALLAAAGDEPESIHIVQFVTQPLEVYRQAVRELGGTVYKYLAQHSHLVKMTPAVADAVRGLPFVRWVGAYQPAYRLEPWLVDHADDAQQAYPLLRYNIMVFEPQHKAVVAQAIRALGGVVNHATAGKLLLEATLTPAQLFDVVTWNEVLFVDRWGPIETDMDIAREIGGANYVETIEGFTGEGVRGEVLDVGFNVSHVDFQAQPLIQHTAVGVDSHGASTSGIIFGDGTGDALGRGLLPSGQGIIAWTDVVFSGPGRYTHTGELLEAPYFAVLHSSSVGSPQVTEYTTTSAEIDVMLFDWDILHCQSQSNTGSQLSRPQAWAKNIVSVGGIRHMDTLTQADDCWGCRSSMASIGPASDGRVKPDLSHFYDNIFTVTTGSDTAYTTGFGGTSGATPIVAGHFGLFFQMWSEGVLGYPVNPDSSVFENRPHMTTAKAVLINTADAYSFSGPGDDLTRVHQGWGFPSLQALHDIREKMFIIDETQTLANLQSTSYDVTVDPGEAALRVTLVYADPPGVPASTRHRINDVTLKVTAPDATVYWGNNGLLDGNWSAAGGVPNTVDTVENVFVENPAAGTWTVEVSADEVNEDGHVETAALDIDFALVVSGVQQMLPAMLLRLPDGTPALVAPGTPTDIAVEILSGAETPVPALALLHYRFDPGDSFATAVMSAAGGVDFIATLPGTACDSTPQFYFSAEGDGGTVITDPANAPASLYETEVGTFVTIASDDFEADQGWTVQNSPNLTSGAWERGIPVGGGDRGDPPTDFDGSGQCYLTENVDGDSDVDGGLTRLISPAFDLTGLDANINYALWYSNSFGGDPNNDLFVVDVSNDDGGTWTNAETFGPAAGGGWSLQSFRVSDFVTPTATVRVRFDASDLNAGSIVEAGLDAFSITKFECETTCPADLDGDGTVGIGDFLIVLGFWGGPQGDIDGDGTTGIEDFLLVIGNWGPCP